MTRQTQTPSGFPRYGVPVRAADAPVRSGNTNEEAARAGSWAAAPWPSQGRPPQGRPPQQAAAPQPGVPVAPAAPGGRVAQRAAITRARRERSLIGVVPYLAVLLCTIAGVYIAFRDGSAGGGAGGVIAGLALLMGAVIRAVLPARLAGLLASRRRATDVVTLAAFGACLLIAGLVLPRLGPLSAQGRMAGPPMKGKHG
ncbi:MAG: DUF3017 domain-containing protein [Trebonia sp.]|uniref:DUF3017 domain-containing protein n=1 Tax=Trebonia sp. TaxID=2767075 RepID=UPI003BAFC607